MPCEAFVDRVADVVRKRTDDTGDQALEVLDKMVVGDFYLVMGCLEGNERAIELFLKRFKAYIRKLCRKNAPSMAIAEEVEQELLATLFTPKRASEPASARLNTYRGTGSLQGWLRVTARRLVLDLLRSPSFKDTAGREGEFVSSRADETDESAEAQLEEIDAIAQLRPLLVTCVLELADPERRLLRYYYADGLVLREIAVRVGVDPATVFRRLVAIRKKLWAVLRKRAHEELRLEAEDLRLLVAGLSDQVKMTDLFAQALVLEGLACLLTPPVS